MPNRSVLLPFLLFVAVSGGSPLAIRATFAEISPLWGGAMRFLLAALILWGLVYLRRTPLPKGRALLGAVLYGILTVGLDFSFARWGLVATPASRAQILMANVPLMTLFLSALHGVEGITPRGLLGALLAVGGIGLTFGGANVAGFSLPHAAAILVAAVFIAEGGVIVKKFPSSPPEVTNAIGMTAGGLILVVVSLVRGERWTVPSQPGIWLAFGYLIVFVSVLAFLLYLFVLNRWSASGASYGFVLMPLVTIVLGSTLAGEQITWNFLAGTGLVLVGVVVGALLPSATKTAAVEACRACAGEVLPRCV